MNVRLLTNARMLTKVQTFPENDEAALGRLFAFLAGALGDDAAPATDEEEELLDLLCT